MIKPAKSNILELFGDLFLCYLIRQRVEESGLGLWVVSGIWKWCLNQVQSPIFGAEMGYRKGSTGTLGWIFFIVLDSKIQNVILELLSGTEIWLIFGFWGDSLVNNLLIRQLTSGYRRWRQSPVDNNKLTRKKKISPSFPNELMVQNSDEIW